MERITVQSFHQDPESGSVPLEDLDQCAPAIAKREHTAGVRVEMEFQFDDRRQTRVAFTEVCAAACQINGSASGKIKHSSLTPEEGLPSAWMDSPHRSRSGGYFPGDRSSQGNFPCFLRFGSPEQMEALRTPSRCPLLFRRLVTGSFGSSNPM